MKLEEIKRVAVVGLGKMGCDWAAQFLESGLEVVGYDSSSKAREEAVGRVFKALRWIEDNRKGNDKTPCYSPKFAEEKIRLFSTEDNEDVIINQGGKIQIFLECIFEDPRAKREIFAKYRRLGSHTLYWTNTSSLDVREMANASGWPQNVIGTHGMNPVYMMPAVEVILHDRVSEETILLTLEVLKKLGKVPFMAQNVPGFWVNKQLMPFLLEAYRALERGEITVEEGDKGLKYSLGHPQGVFLLSDYIGLATVYRIVMAIYFSTQDPRYYPPSILAKLFEKGEWGRKAEGESLGFYEWKDGKMVCPRDFKDWVLKI